jgi:F0F1-type ATP synthase membrane subunit c/vacuolar-type H+-ATPase subunit K
MTPQQLMSVRVLWSSLVLSNALIVVVGMVAIAKITDPSVLDLGRLVPDDSSVGAIIWFAGWALLAASFVVPQLLIKAAGTSPTTPLSFERMYTPFIISMALAEACTLMGFVSALFMGPQVPERMLLPAAAAILVGLTRFPTGLPKRHP